MAGVIASKRLPATNDGVDIELVEFNPITPPAHALRSHQSGAAAEKGVEHDLAARGAVQNGVGDQLHRLYSWMQREVALLRECARTRIGPNVGAIATEFAEQDVVAVRRGRACTPE